eukprot:57232_1
MDLNLVPLFNRKPNPTIIGNRAKCTSFHPTKHNLILVGYHNGSIELINYETNTAETFNEHKCAVRGIDFHKIQPIFASGSDDKSIKVWNYEIKKHLFTLNGHHDYVRTISFHPGTYPWLLSSSDDQTVRIWDWESRTCLSVLIGHSHYVMCAQWHPTKDLLLSASLDNTIRIWDISGLRKRMFSNDDRYQFRIWDTSVKFVLEGHSRGVNWASFHPTMSLVVSASDDREIKVWRFSENRAWEIITYRGHLNNISSVLFYANENIVISCSEDKSIRIWDLSRTRAPLKFQRDDCSRYWMLETHPYLNLLAASHDNGLTIFKLQSNNKVEINNNSNNNVDTVT